MEIRVLLKTELISKCSFPKIEDVYISAELYKCVLTLISLSLYLHRAHFAKDHY